MNMQQDLQSKKSSTLCPQCSAFYGTQATNILCSSCYKKKASQKNEEIIEKSPAITSTAVSVAEKEMVQAMQQVNLEGQKREQKDRKRCFDCSKKLGLLGIECKCGFVYCNGHRLPEHHSCQFDHKLSGKEKLKREVVKVCNGKIKDI